MTLAQSLDYQVSRFGFWSAVVAIATGIVALFFPLDVPDGYNAEHAERIAWLTEHRSLFIAGWVNQIVAMFSLSAVIACAALVAAARNAFQAMLGALFTAMATMASKPTKPVSSARTSTGRGSISISSPLFFSENKSIFVSPSISSAAV